jgi:alkanesulfonate monooxygenase SsuD/methylene tetrahydromethanopterin reductase-like flavin-dependent oxidoreductase (luciferase family)
MRTTDPTFGWIIPQRGALFGLGTMPELLAYGPRAEASGQFDSLWVGDSITAKPRAESISLLSALAGMTNDLLLGVGCMASFPLRDPVLLAYQWATLDELSGGRTLLNACTGIVSERGASREEGSHYGGVRDVDRPARMEETIGLLRALWTGEPVDWDGAFHHYENLQILPRPVQDPCPIHIAANPFDPRYAERSMKRVATLADGWMVSTPMPGMVDRLWPLLERHLDEAGKDTASFPVTVYANVNIGPDRTACLEESLRFLEMYYGPVFDATMTEAWTAAGTIEECAEHIMGWLEAGATRVALRATSWDQGPQFERLADELLPAVRARLG